MFFRTENFLHCINEKMSLFTDDKQKKRWTAKRAELNNSIEIIRKTFRWNIGTFTNRKSTPYESLKWPCKIICSNLHMGKETIVRGGSVLYETALIAYYQL